ncbi:hypothetical protein BDZ89DRAFT_1154596 [Hymenopellis radicata]|nr:hypothetical protein BDZ89DRAFT_1154596 [Hymenopellis radicata]
MPESIHARPAVKVGGRRLSLSARHKPHMHPESPTAETTPAPKAVDDSVVDYPRPTRPPQSASEDDGHEAPHHEEVPKQEKKHGHDNEKKMKESGYHKVEATRPTREGHFDHKGFGGGGRIAQPSGKGLA